MLQVCGFIYVLYKHNTEDLKEGEGYLSERGSEVYIFARTNVPEKVKGQSSQVPLQPECIPVDGISSLTPAFFQPFRQLAGTIYTPAWGE